MQRLQARPLQSAAAGGTRVERICFFAVRVIPFEGKANLCSLANSSLADTLKVNGFKIFGFGSNCVNLRLTSSRSAKYPECPANITGVSARISEWMGSWTN